jgi:hypothetical protein
MLGDRLFVGCRGGLEPVLTQLGAGYSLSWSRLGTMVAFEAPGGVTA